MNIHKVARLLPPILVALGIASLMLYAYRNLPARPFAADDYQWLLNVRGLSFAEITRKAFDPGAQTHFYRPLIWLLFWAQARAFGFAPHGFHAVSLALHLLNAALLGWLVYRLTKDEGRRTKDERRPSWSLVVRLSSVLVAIAIVALHPAPFEAVVWVSAQSELLAAALLLVALHLWLTTKDEGRRTKDDRLRHTQSFRLSPLVFRPWSLLATLVLALALLTKESAVIGLPLLMLLGRRLRTKNQEPRTKNQSTAKPENQVPSIKHHEQRTLLNSQFSIPNFTPYIPPTLVTLAYIALQIVIERRNYLLAQGGYGLGPQVVLNPLRSLALIVAPLRGTEHADNAWLVPVGALVAAFLLLIFVGDAWFRFRRLQSPISNLYLPTVVALALTLLPTAPFTSPPDSRYLYLPVMAAGLVLIWTMDDGQWTIRSRYELAHGLSSIVYRRGIAVCSLVVILALGWWASSELHVREGRFAAASGPGGSLWRVAQATCAEARPDRVVIVEPPVAAPHVEAIVELACGDETGTKIVGGDQVEGAIKGHTVVITFPNGSAEVQRRT
jgi:hypothetical protein